VEEIENVMVLKIQKRVLGSIKGLNKRQSCRQIFKVLKILTATALYVFEVLYYIKIQHVYRMNLNMYAYNIRRKWDLLVHALSCNTVGPWFTNAPVHEQFGS
jgi:hypothetical protein